MFPPSEGTPLDTTRGYALELPCTPNILIAPSDVAPFAKATPLEQRATLTTEEDALIASDSATKVICINPGRLAKGTSAGTFVHIHVASKGEDEEDGIDKRCRVEIRKL